MDLLLKYTTAVAILVSAICFSSCHDSTQPQTGKVVYTVNLVPGLGSDEAALNELDQLSELFQSGTIEWHFSKNGEAVIHNFQLMGEPFKMRDLIDKQSNTQTVLVEFLGEKIAFQKNEGELKRARELIQSGISHIVNREDRKEILGCDCVGFEGYYESEQQNINYSGYLCEDLEMVASFVQGLDFNPFQGALFEVNVGFGMAQIQYRANTMVKSADRSVFEYQIEDYSIIPAGQLNPGNPLLPGIR